MAQVQQQGAQRWSAGVIPYAQMGYYAPDYVPARTDLLAAFRITPQPAMRVEYVDAFGNRVTRFELDRLRYQVMLGLDELLEQLMPEGREEVSWATVAAILTIARFCEPSSELHIADTWYRRTALEELLGVAPEQVHTDRLYKGSASA